MKVSHSFHSLFTSKTRQKLINIFFYSPENIFYVRELVRLSEEEINSVRRELANLESSSIISKEVRGNRLYYWANPTSYLYYSLQIMANKHTGLGARFQESRVKLGNLKALFYSQEFLLHRLQNHGNIDLLIVGDVSLKLTEELVKVEEKAIGREINYMVMDLNELNLRLNKRDPIMVDFLLKYPSQIIGNPIEIFK